MEKKKHLYLACAALVVLPSLCFSANDRSESDFFKYLAAQFQENSDRLSLLPETRRFLKMYPRSPYFQRVEYIGALCLGDTLEALEAYQEIIGKDMGRNKFGRLVLNESERAMAVSSLYKIAQISYNHGDYVAAQKNFKSLLLRFKKSYLEGESLFGLLQTQFALCQWADAEETVGRLVAFNPLYKDDPRVLLAAGIISFNKNDFEKAYEQLRTLNGVEGLYYQGRSLEQLKKYIPAITVFRQLLNAYPDNRFKEEVRFLIGDCFYRSSDYDSALKEFTAFAADFPASPRTANVQFTTGCCYYQKGDFARAADVFRYLAGLPSAGDYAPLARYFAAECLLRQKRFDVAVKTYEGLIASYPSSSIIPRAYYHRAWAAFNQNDYKGAVASCDDLVRKFPDSSLVPEALYLAAAACRGEGENDRAIDYYEQVLNAAAAAHKQELVESALLMIVKTYGEQKKYNEIVSVYHYMVNAVPWTTSPLRPYTCLLMAEAYYYLGMYSDAEKLYNTVMEKFPFSKAATLSSEGKAWIYFQSKEYDLAKKERSDLLDTMNILSSTATKISSEFEMGNIYFNEKKYLEALDVFEKFAAQYPAHELVPEALYNAGRCYYKLEYYSKAIEQWEKLTAGYPKHPRAMEAMGLAADTYFRAQKYAQAIATYRSSRETYPGTELAKQAQLRIAQSYYNSGDDARAILEFEQFMRAYPDDPLTNTALEGIDMASYKLMQSGADAGLDIQVMERFLESFPQSKFAPSVQYRLAERYYAKKDYHRAAEGFMKVYNGALSDENVANATFFLAESLYQSARYADAVPVYRRFIGNFSDHDYASLSCLHLANSLYYLQQYVDAAQVYLELTQRPHVNEDVASTALLNAGLCYRKAEKWGEAVLVDQRFVERYPKSDKAKDVLLELAETYESLNQSDKAVASYRQLLAALPAADALFPEIRYRIADICFKQERGDQGIVELNAIVPLQPADHPWRLSALARLGQEYEKKKDRARALDAYRQLLRSTADEKWTTAAKERIDALETAQADSGTNK